MMGNTYGAAKFPSLFSNCVMHWNGENETINGFPIIPSGVTVTPSGTWANPLDLGNNKSMLKFDGSTNYISLSNNANLLMGSNNFTIAFWARLSTIPATGVNYFIWCGTDSQFYALQLKAGGSIYFQGYATSAYLWIINSGAGSIVINTWVYITCVRNGNYQAIYINGVQTGSTGSSSGALGTHTNPFFISNCSYDYGNPNAITGNIKDLLIYKDRALTLPEIKLVMARTHPLTGTGMMPINGDYWRISP